MDRYDLEEAFDEFIKSYEYRKAESSQFRMARLAFVAGWRLAGGAVHLSDPEIDRLAGLIPAKAPEEL